MKTDTIAAIATALGSGGISIVRISGDEALSIIDKIYRAKSSSKDYPVRKAIPFIMVL